MLLPIIAAKLSPIPRIKTPLRAFSQNELRFTSSKLYSQIKGQDTPKSKQTCVKMSFLESLSSINCDTNQSRRLKIRILVENSYLKNSNIKKIHISPLEAIKVKFGAMQTPPEKIRTTQKWKIFLTQISQILFLHNSLNKIPIIVTTTIQTKQQIEFFSCRVRQSIQKELEHFLRQTKILTSQLKEQQLMISKINLQLKKYLTSNHNEEQMQTIDIKIQYILLQIKVLRRM
ncbi:hypothetical protein TTHERM_000684609 (macronuclear) [Tetrahymena thermophila SB210]|uniref:Uncharacterized protein n=1 Tax=Tetrahymena thermophila (strain SB210) TaxID=312017 RepID=W7XFU1_TETTS|nr:hypothetical protein TTHERM_000684609 [Tetrahymena thermophila SB210]EWS71694.1 hypothetical protein TTHERM_000684609 [Tetrahymena thermophila SB210]|eukprot:XP_012655766.1 hypothetical protein TTHERM_000684609 [Tetrahymena thermophila SB210]